MLVLLLALLVLPTVADHLCDTEIDLRMLHDLHMDVHHTTLVLR